MEHLIPASHLPQLSDTILRNHRFYQAFRVQKWVNSTEHLIPVARLPELSVPQLFSWWRLFRNHTSLYTSDCALLVRFSFDCALVFVSTSVCFRPCVRLWFIPIFIFFVGLFSFLCLFLFSFSVSCPSLALFSFLLPF